MRGVALLRTSFGTAAFFSVAAWGPRPCLVARCRFTPHPRAQEEPGKQDLPQQLAPPVRAKKGAEDETLLVQWGAVLSRALVACQ